VNWKLATAAFMEGYHVPQTHPPAAAVRAERPPRRKRCTPSSRAVFYFMRTLGDGMGGMTHENDIRIAEGPARPSHCRPIPAEALAEWRKRPQRRGGQLASGTRQRHGPTSTTLFAVGLSTQSGFCFPHPLHPAHL